MRHLKYLAFVACLGSLSPALAQNASKSLTIDDLVTWQRITDREISDNGKWVACKMEPWEGDATVYLYAAQGQETADRKSTRLNSSHYQQSRMPSSA